MIRYRSLMPEKHTTDLIRSSLDIKNNAYTLTGSGICLSKFQHDGTGKILISQIRKAVIFSDIDHAAQILDQTSVRIICRCLIKKATAVCIGIKHDLHGINDGRFSTSGMPGKKIDPIIKRKGPVFNIMPVVQAYPGQGFKSLIFHLPLLLRGMFPTVPAHRPPSGSHEWLDKLPDG